jgi:hypothetical protein
MDRKIDKFGNYLGYSTPKARYSSHQPLYLTGEIDYRPKAGLKAIGEEIDFLRSLFKGG